MSVIFFFVFLGVRPKVVYDNNNRNNSKGQARDSLELSWERPIAKVVLTSRPLDRSSRKIHSIHSKWKKNYLLWGSEVIKNEITEKNFFWFFYKIKEPKKVLGSWEKCIYFVFFLIHYYNLIYSFYFILFSHRSNKWFLGVLAGHSDVKLLLQKE